MKEIPASSSLPDVPPAQDFSKLGFIYITVLRLANQVMTHTGNLCPGHCCKLSCQDHTNCDRPASPVGVQPDSDIGCDKSSPFIAIATDL
ncbi:hypothetical protein DSO57_1014861, partial [Entomophthora muscae]